MIVAKVSTDVIFCNYTGHHNYSSLTSFTRNGGEELIAKSTQGYHYCLPWKQIEGMACMADISDIPEEPNRKGCSPLWLENGSPVIFLRLQTRRSLLQNSILGCEPITSWDHVKGHIQVDNLELYLLLITRYQNNFCFTQDWGIAYIWQIDVTWVAPTFGTLHQMWTVALHILWKQLNLCQIWIAVNCITRAVSEVFVEPLSTNTDAVVSVTWDASIFSAWPIPCRSRTRGLGRL